MIIKPISVSVRLCEHFINVLKVVVAAAAAVVIRADVG